MWKRHWKSSRDALLEAGKSMSKATDFQQRVLSAHAKDICFGMRFMVTLATEQKFETLTNAEHLLVNAGLKLYRSSFSTSLRSCHFIAN